MIYEKEEYTVRTLFPANLCWAWEYFCPNLKTYSGKSGRVWGGTQAFCIPFSTAYASLTCTKNTTLKKLLSGRNKCQSGWIKLEGSQGLWTLAELSTYCKWESFKLKGRFFKIAPVICKETCMYLIFVRVYYLPQPSLFKF